MLDSQNETTINRECKQQGNIFLFVIYNGFINFIHYLINSSMPRRLIVKL